MILSRTGKVRPVEGSEPMITPTVMLMQSPDVTNGWSSFLICNAQRGVVAFPRLDVLRPASMRAGPLQWTDCWKHGLYAKTERKPTHSKNVAFGGGLSGRGGST